MPRYIAFGDVHGMYDQFITLFNKIDYQEDDILVFLGDYIDRGPKSKEVLDFLMNPPVKNKIVCLRGNHEDMWFQSYNPNGYFSSRLNMLTCWLGNGGIECIKSFGVTDGMMIPDKYIEWIKNNTVLFYQPIYTNLLFVHAGINPNYPLNEQAESELMWIRDEFLNSTKDFGVKVIHGHTPHMAGIDVRPNRINVDTGSCFGGAVSAVVLDKDGNVLEMHSEKCPTLN